MFDRHGSAEPSYCAPLSSHGDGDKAQGVEEGRKAALNGLMVRPGPALNASYNERGKDERKH
jgi:hypothetical protein